MTYNSWLESHTIKHKKIMDKLTDLSDDEVIEYFRFENMVENELDFCPLYKDNTKCHEMENLNCYLCACPHFRVGEKKSYCDINSKDGGSIVANDGYIHQDCSKCCVPHHQSYIKKNFNRNWSIIFNNSIVGTL